MNFACTKLLDSGIQLQLFSIEKMCLAVVCFLCKETVNDDWKNRLNGKIIHANCDSQLKLFSTERYQCKSFCPTCNRSLWNQPESLLTHWDEHQGYLHHYTFVCICGTECAWNEYIDYHNPNKDSWILC